MPVSSMKVEVRYENDVTVIVPVGSLVIGQPEQAINETVTRLLADGRARLVVDLGEVRKIDSSGIETLLTACQRAREAAGDVRLARVAPRFQTLLEIAHLTNVLKIYPDVEAAIKDFVLYTPRP
ncbi:MAG: STAS domain-containing protein [Acidobacteriota bacterium]|nr:STAS domain-containing protein [Acidobacteriota bacterium]